MNFLAHIFLSGEQAPIMVGNFIADFVRGKAMFDYPENIRQGILLHRAIDTFADRHEMARLSAERLRPNFGRYAPVLVDIFYDHLLAVNWHRYHHKPLPDYAQWAYKTLAEHLDVMPPMVQQVIPRMTSQDWLSNYANLWGISKALEGVSHRAAFENNMADSLYTLEAEFEVFQRDFLAFFPEMQSHASKTLEGLG